MENQKAKWFVIADYPWEGIYLEEFTDEEKAKEQFIQSCKEHEDVLLIEGKILAQKGEL